MPRVGLPPRMRTPTYRQDPLPTDAAEPFGGRRRAAQPPPWGALASHRNQPYSPGDERRGLGVVVPRVRGVVPRVLGVVPRVLGVGPRVLGVVPRVLGGGPQGTREWSPGY